MISCYWSILIKRVNSHKSFAEKHGYFCPSKSQYYTFWKKASPAYCGSTSVLTQIIIDPILTKIVINLRFGIWAKPSYKILFSFDKMKLYKLWCHFFVLNLGNLESFLVQGSTYISKWLMSKYQEPFIGDSKNSLHTWQTKF